MAYADWQKVVMEDPTINEEQKQRLLSIVSTPLPAFDPTLAQTISNQAQAKGAEWLNGRPSAPTALNPYITSESQAYADKLNKVADNLRTSNSAYNAGQMDVNRALNRNQDSFKDFLAKLGMAFDTGAAIQNRNSQTQISEINRQSQYNSMREGYKRKVDELKRQADEAKRRGDTQAWINAIAAIGAIIGTVATGGIGGAAAGAIISAGGNAMYNR